MIKVFSRKLAVTVGAQLRANRDTVEIFAYGLEIILGTLFQLTLLILLSLIMNTFVTTMICLIAFASLRYFGGGVHLSTYLRCLTVGAALILGLGKLATIDVSLELLTVISIFALLLGICTIFNWVPAGTEKKITKDVSTKLRQKKKAFLALILWFIVTVVLVKHNLIGYAFAAVLGSLSSLLLMTPWGYRAVKALDKL